MASPVPHGALLVAVLAAGGCRFDAAGIEGEPELDDAGGRLTDAGSIDAAVCTEVTARIRVDDVEHTSATAPAATVLIGDTVALSSQGSCGPTALAYQWQVSPVTGIRDTIEPADDAAAITVFATVPDAYSVTLTVSAAGEVAVTTIYAFDAAGFAELVGVPTKVGDLDVGDGQLWAATDSGAVRLPLATLAPVTSINDEALGGGPNALPGKQEAILWDDARQVTWIGGSDAAPGVWRVDYGAVMPVTTRVDFAAALGGNARTTELALVGEPEPGTLAATTELGVAFAPDGAAFASAFVPASGPVELGAAVEADETWAVGSALFAIDTGRVFQLFGNGKATGLVADLDGLGLWAGIEGEGIAHAELDGAGIQLTTFDALNGLPSSNVRSVAIESAGRAAGDVWVATSRGLARWKADRQTWVGYGNPQGLMGFLDLDAVVVHAPADGVGRAVFAGGNAGAVYSRVP